MKWTDILWTALIAVAAVAVANRIPGLAKVVNPSPTAAKA